MFDINIPEWLNLIVRWAHITAGIAWIGSSFHFVFTDASLRPRDGLDTKAHGETWQVHGGGFYRIVKYLVSPDKMPSELHWFKYEAYFTWITGFLLLAVIYYYGANSFLIDPSVLALTPPQAIFISIAILTLGWLIYDSLCRSPWGKRTGPLAAMTFALVVGAAWIFSQVFSGRGAFIHAGVFIGTLMAANVFFIIIPNQKKVVKALVAGETPDPRLGAQAKQRSMHNNYLTLPVLLMMVSSHYPMLYSHPRNWLLLALILLVGALVRHYYNSRHAGVRAPWINGLYPAAAVVMLVIVLLVSWRPQATPPTAAAEAVSDKQAFALVRTHCMACHSATPTHPDWDAAPLGVKFDTLEEVLRLKDKIRQQAVESTIMPLGNETGMTTEERRTLGAWIARHTAAGNAP